MIVVVNEQNKAYILKQQVAEGYTLGADEVAKNGLVYKSANDAPVAANPTDINNWLSVGTDFSGDIADLDGRIDTLETFKTAVDNRLNVQDASGLAYDENNHLQVKIAPDTEDVMNGLTVTENGLKVATYNLRAVNSDDVAEGYAAQYKFTVDGQTITTINIPKDQVLKNAEILTVTEANLPYSGAVVGDKYIKFVFHNNETPQYLAVQDLVDVYTAPENGHVKIDENNQITLNIESLAPAVGLALDIPTVKSNVSANASAISALQARLDGTGEGEDHVAGLEEKVTANSDAIDTLNGQYTVLGNALDTTSKKATANESAISALQATVANLNVQGVDETASNGVSLSLVDHNVKVNVDLETLRSNLQVNANAVLLTEDIKDKEDSEEARYTTGSSVQSILADLNARVISIDADIQSALEGGVTGIEAGNGIAVDSTTATKPKVSIKIASNSSLKATTDGLDIVWTEL